MSWPVRRACLALLFASLTGLGAARPSPAAAQDTALPNAVIVLDGSGSMWGTMEGDKEAKFYASRAFLRDLLTKAPPQSRVGLTSFGHRRKGDCGDVEIIAPPEAGSAERIIAALETLNPRGKGPISSGLREAAKSLGPGTGGTIILIHDGPDNCQQDVCAAAADIAKTNPKLAIHVLSLGLAKPDAQRMACVAQATGGKQFDVADQGSMGLALDDVFKIAGLDAQAAAAPQVTAAAALSQATGPPGLRLTASLAEAGPMLTVPVSWRISKDGAENIAVIERKSPEINEALPPGRYAVLVNYGLVTRRDLLDVTDKGPTTARLALNAGTLALTAKANKLGDSLFEPALTITPVASSNAAVQSEPIWIGREPIAELIVPAGDYVVAVRDGLAGANATTTVAAGSRATTDIVLETGRLELTASAFDGGPPLNRTVFLVAVDDPDAPQGRREIARSAAPNPLFTLQAGTYYVTARLGSNEVRERVALSSGDVVKRTIVLGTARLALAAALHGAQLPSGTPVVYRVFETAATKRVVAHSTAAEPQFELTAGRYRVEAQVGTLNVKTSQLIDVVAGKDTKTTLKLEASQLSLGPDLQSAAANGVSRVEIRDASGRTVWRSRRGDTRTALLAPGTYTVRIETGGRPTDRPVNLKTGEQHVLQHGGL